MTGPEDTAAPHGPVADCARLCLADPTLPANHAALAPVRDRLAAHFAGGDGGTVHQPALLVEALAALGLPLPLAAQRRLEALALRERARAALVAAQHARITALIAAEAIPALIAAGGITALPIRGWPLACRLYRDPATRHCHALRWLVPAAADRARFDRVLADAGWARLLPVPVQSPHKRLRIGPGLVTVEVLARLFPWSNATPDAAEAQSPAWLAAEIIGASLFEGPALSLRWAIDLALLLRAETVDPATFAAHVTRCGFATSARARLAEVARLVDPADAALHGTLAALSLALTGRDAPQVAALIRVRPLSRTPLRLLLTAPLHPRIAWQALHLWRQRRRTRAGAQALRRRLRPQTASGARDRDGTAAP